MKLSLDTTIINPISRNKPKNAIILLHGYGGSGKDISLLTINWTRFLPDTIFFCPNGPEKCSITPSGHQWFDLFYNTTHIGVAFPWHIAVSPSGMKFMVNHLSGTGSGNHTKFTSGTLGVAGVANITATNYLGIAL